MYPDNIRVMRIIRTASKSLAAIRLIVEGIYIFVSFFFFFFRYLKHVAPHHTGFLFFEPRVSASFPSAFSLQRRLHPREDTINPQLVDLTSTAAVMRLSL